MVAEIICSCDYDVSWHLGPKYSSRVISLNQRLIITNPQNQSVTDRQIDKQIKRQDDYYTTLSDMHAEG